MRDLVKSDIERLTHFYTSTPRVFELELHDGKAICRINGKLSNDFQISAPESYFKGTTFICTSRDDSTLNIVDVLKRKGDDVRVVYDNRMEFVDDLCDDIKITGITLHVHEAAEIINFSECHTDDDVYFIVQGPEHVHWRQNNTEVIFGYKDHALYLSRNAQWVKTMNKLTGPEPNTPVAVIECRMNGDRTWTMINTLDSSTVPFTDYMYKKARKGETITKSDIIRKMDCIVR